MAGHSLSNAVRRRAGNGNLSGRSATKLSAPPIAQRIMGKPASLVRADAIMRDVEDAWMAARRELMDSTMSVADCVTGFADCWQKHLRERGINVPVHRHWKGATAKQAAAVTLFTRLPNPQPPRYVIGMASSQIRREYVRERTRQTAMLRDGMKFRDISDEEERKARARAAMIARTEAVALATEEIYARAQELIDDGLFDETEIFFTWIVTDDDLLDEEICEPLTDEQVGFGEEFNLSTGDNVKGPPAHPNCRCGLEMDFEEHEEVDFISTPGLDVYDRGDGNPRYRAEIQKGLNEVASKYEMLTTDVRIYDTSRSFPESVAQTVPQHRPEFGDNPVPIILINSGNPAWLYPMAMEGYMAVPTPVGIILHENGHVFHDLNLKLPYEWDKVPGVSLSELRKVNLREHAFKNPREFFAEVYSLQKLGLDIPPAAQRAYNIMLGMHD